MSLPLNVLPSPQTLHVVFLHGDDEHRAGDGAADRRRVEVGHAGGRDVERAALQRREAFGDQLLRGSRRAAPSRRRTAAPCGESRRSPVRRAVRGSPCRRTESRPCSRIQCRAALVSRPPENAMPTFCPLGMLWRIVAMNDCKYAIARRHHEVTKVMKALLLKEILRVLRVFVIRCQKLSVVPKWTRVPAPMPCATARVVRKKAAENQMPAPTPCAEGLVGQAAGRCRRPSRRPRTR